VFDLIHNALARLDEPDAPAPAVLAWFQWRLLRHVGLLGQLRDCVSCGKPVAGEAGKAARDVHFSSIQGGLLCGACEPAAAEKCRLDRDALAGLAALTAAEAGKKVLLPDRQARGINRLLNYHVTQQLGRQLKSARHAITDLT